MNESEAPHFDFKNRVEGKREPNAGFFNKNVTPAFSKILKTIVFNRNYMKGNGDYLWDDNEQKYLDSLSGFGMFNIGNINCNHPQVPFFHNTL